MTPSTAILYSNSDNSTFVIDIPHSILLVQGCNAIPSERSLLSCEPLKEPMKTPEPKSEKSIRRSREHDESNQEWLADLMERVIGSLREVHAAGILGDRFCLPRMFLPPEPRGKRKRGRDSTDSEDVAALDRPRHLLSLLTKPTGYGSVDMQLQPYGDHDDAFADKHDNSSLNSPNEWNGYVQNKSREPQRLSLTHDSSSSTQETFHFHIPPLSAFLLGDCQDAESFHKATRTFASHQEGKFDLILLDPPWPNKSARRKSSYSTKHHLYELYDLLIDMDLQTRLQPGGYVAIWITMNAAIRRLVLEGNRLFERLNVALVEEWTWLKVTEKGEPSVSINSVWRKPYETLLIGQAPTNTKAFAEASPEIAKRTIIGVPDTHSRKPCLKELFRQLLFGGKDDFRAAEIFARYLVDGWMSWGNEPIKYNWEEHWVKAEKAKEMPIR